jgi:hypothetical protein
MTHAPVRRVALGSRTVTRDECADLLALACRAERRIAPDPKATTIVWLEIFGDLSYEDGRRLALEHYRSSTDPLMPAHLLNRRYREKIMERAFGTADPNAGF